MILRLHCVPFGHLGVEFLCTGLGMVYKNAVPIGKLFLYTMPVFHRPLVPVGERALQAPAAGYLARKGWAWGAGQHVSQVDCHVDDEHDALQERGGKRGLAEASEVGLTVKQHRATQ